MPYKAPSVPWKITSTMRRVTPCSDAPPSGGSCLKRPNRTWPPAGKCMKLGQAWARMVRDNKTTGSKSADEIRGKYLLCAVAPAILEGTQVKTVFVIGAGPAGMFAAQKIAQGGHEVIILNRDIKPGGLAEYGI